MGKDGKEVVYMLLLVGGFFIVSARLLDSWIFVKFWHSGGLWRTLNKNLSYCRRTARRAVSVKTLSTAAQLEEQVVQQIHNKLKYCITVDGYVVNSHDASTVVGVS